MIRRAVRRALSFARCCCIAVVAPGLSAAAGADDAATVTIFAAASTTNAVNEISALYEAAGRATVRPVYAASSTLAKQIARGAPADLFLSANTAWMDLLAEQAALEPGSSRTLLGNELVLVAPSDSTLSLDVKPGFALAAALGRGRLAIGDPAHVPVGIYAKAALEALGVWGEVEGKTAVTANVRAALALVESGAAAAGIVYASDAKVSERIRLVGRFPPDSHPAIGYPLALVAGRDSPTVRAFYDFLQGPEAAAVFARHGFRPLVSLGVPTGTTTGAPTGEPEG